MADDTTNGAESEGGADLEQRLETLEKHLTSRINDLATQVTDAVADIDTKTAATTTELKRLGTRVTNNAESVASFQSTLDRLATEVAKARVAAETVGRRLDTIEEWQSSINTALLEAAQGAKDFALEQGQAATKHADDAVAHLEGKLTAARTDLEQRITQVEQAPVKPHTHVFHVEGVTGAVQQGGNA